MSHVSQLKVPFNEDNQKLDKFIDLYIEYEGDNNRAWVDAGFAESSQSHSMSKLRKHWDEVQKRIVQRMGAHVPKALAMVVHLMENAKNDSVRLKAAQDLLGRAGYDQASRIELTDKKVEELSKDELRDELSELLAKARVEGKT